MCDLYGCTLGTDCGNRVADGVLSLCDEKPDNSTCELLDEEFAYEEEDYEDEDFEEDEDEDEDEEEDDDGDEEEEEEEEEDDDKDW